MRVNARSSVGWTVTNILLAVEASRVEARRLSLYCLFNFDVRYPKIRYRLGRSSSPDISSPPAGGSEGAELDGIAEKSIRNGEGCKEVRRRSARWC
jgi:hypothetical protein